MGNIISGVFIALQDQKLMLEFKFYWRLLFEMAKLKIKVKPGLMLLISMFFSARVHIQVITLKQYPVHTTSPHTHTLPHPFPPTP